MSDDSVNNALGICAAVLLALCLMPQIWKIFKTKSAEDISYGWTTLYFAGLIFYFVYLYRIDALVGWIGILVEAVLVVILVAGKVWLEHYYLPRHPELQRVRRGAPVDANTEVKGDIEAQGLHLRRSLEQPLPAGAEPHGVTRVHHVDGQQVPTSVKHKD